MTDRKTARKMKTGIVTSDRMEKTVVVKVERFFTHPLFKKRMKKSKKFKVHDPENKVKIGDKVKIMETRPVSKGKCWRVSEVIKKAVQ